MGRGCGDGESEIGSSFPSFQTYINMYLLVTTGRSSKVIHNTLRCSWTLQVGWWAPLASSFLPTLCLDNETMYTDRINGNKALFVQLFPTLNNPFQVSSPLKPLQIFVHHHFRHSFCTNARQSTRIHAWSMSSPCWSPCAHQRRADRALSLSSGRGLPPVWTRLCALKVNLRRP